MQTQTRMSLRKAAGEAANENCGETGSRFRQITLNIHNNTLIGL